MTYTVPEPLKDRALAYLLLAATLLGFAGLHHFYLGKPLRGVLWFLTWGLLGVGSIYDICTLGRQVRRSNEQRIRAAR